jgi:O-methyltransferase
MVDVRDMYLDLLRSCLTGYGEDELIPIRAGNHPGLRGAFDILAKHNIRVARVRPFDEQKRSLGLDWPASAETMIGMQRLTHLQHCVETLLTEEIPGDLIECGVWRGGACILMRAVLTVYGDEERCVWLADSFEGLPPSDPENYPADKGLRFNRANYALAITESTVRNNFKRYGLLDDRVRFLPGWFKNTLPEAPIDRVALLRLDGDLYESTIQALDALYPKLSVGGFCIIDDYVEIGACRQAVTDYRRKNSISAEIIDIDGSGVYWRKSATEANALDRSHASVVDQSAESSRAAISSSDQA